MTTAQTTYNVVGMLFRSTSRAYHVLETPTSKKTGKKIRREGTKSYGWGPLSKRRNVRLIRSLRLMIPHP